MLFFCLLLFCSTLCAQSLHEFSLHSGGGLSALRYNPKLGKQSNGLDRHFGFGYVFFVAPWFGLATGTEIAFYSAEFNMKNFKTQYWATDFEGEDFEFRSDVSKYKEKQVATMLQIPLMLQIQTGVQYQYYLMAGAKIAVSLPNSHSSSSNFINSGHYEEENYEYITQQFVGFGTFTDRRAENKANFKSTVFASMEAGMKWKFQDGLSIYTGAYFDYGLTDILKKQNAEQLPQIVEYYDGKENPPHFAVNSVFHSKDNTSQAFVNKVMPMAAGIKVKLALGL